MSDETLRSLERAAQDDAEATARFAAACRRVGRPSPHQALADVLDALHREAAIHTDYTRRLPGPPLRWPTIEEAMRLRRFVIGVAFTSKPILGVPTVIHEIMRFARDIGWNPATAMLVTPSVSSHGATP